MAKDTNIAQTQIFVFFGICNKLLWRGEAVSSYVVLLYVVIFRHVNPKIKIKTKEHNNRQNFNICIRNLDTNKQRQKANKHFWKESVQKNFRPRIWQWKTKLENINQ